MQYVQKIFFFSGTCSTQINISFERQIEIQIDRQINVSFVHTKLNHCFQFSARINFCNNLQTKPTIQNIFPSEFSFYLCGYKENYVGQQLRSEAYPTVGYKGHIPLSNHILGGICPLKLICYIKNNPGSVQGKINLFLI